jgi:hypothetical protein
MTMVRKQIYLKQSQDDSVKREAERRGVTEAEVIRECIDKQLPNDERARRREAGERLMALIRARQAEIPNGGSTVKFDRESLYER